MTTLDRSASPLLLVHSINGAASAREMKPLVDAFGARRSVFALELPGYGLSTREDLDYTPRLMAQAILRAALHIAALGFEAPIHLITLSLSCEFGAIAVLDAPERFASLGMISPTGLRGRGEPRYQDGATREIAVVRWLFKDKPWSARFFRLLVSPKSIRFFLRKTWGSKAIDEDLFEYCLVTTQVPGARHAPLSFVSGSLFTKGIAELYARIDCPVWVVHGQRGDFTDYRGIKALGPPRHWSVHSLDTGALPQFEQLAVVESLYEEFLARNFKGER
jgi:pimeloyl-ACP methyl ester carboxylesterase